MLPHPSAANHSLTRAHLLTPNNTYSIYHLMCSAAFSAPSPLPDSWLCSLHLPLFFNLSSPSSSGTHCGYMIPPIMVSASDTLSVTFKSDSRLTDRGFSAKWQAVYPEDITGTHTNTGAHSHLKHTLCSCCSSSTPH